MAVSLLCRTHRNSPWRPQTRPEIPRGEQLRPHQIQALKELVGQFRDVFSETPGRTTLAYHHIRTEPGVTVQVKPYHIPEVRREAIQEVRSMRQLGVIEESQSRRCSPVVLVPKPHGSVRFCNDFCKLNEVAQLDAYSMPRVDELTDRLGTARYFSTLDLTKGYWQVPLWKGTREKMVFATPDGLLPVHGPALRSTWSPCHLPAPDGPCPETAPGLCSGLLSSTVTAGRRTSSDSGPCWRLFERPPGALGGLLPGV